MSLDLHYSDEARIPEPVKLEFEGNILKLEFDYFNLYNKHGD
jgi:hypothetical protein